MAISPDRERGIPWNAELPSQTSGTPPASARPSAGSPCARRARPSLLRMRLLQLRSNLSGEGVGDAVCGPRAFFEFTGVPLGLGDQVPDAATPLKIRRGGARSRMPRSPRRRAPLETRRAGEIRRPARPGRGGTGTPATRPLSAWTPEAARCTRSGPPPTSTTSSSPVPACGRTPRFATPARDARARATRPGLPAASPA